VRYFGDGSANGSNHLRATGCVSQTGGAQIARSNRYPLLRTAKAPPFNASQIRIDSATIHPRRRVEPAAFSSFMFDIFHLCFCRRAPTKCPLPGRIQLRVPV
jgi:hypothetical protein